MSSTAESRINPASTVPRTSDDPTVPKPRPPKLSVVGKSLSIAYSLKVPGTAIDPNGRYALRATITVGGELRFTTTRRYPALTPPGGRTRPTCVWMP